jgi:hypothetical protein
MKISNKLIVFTVALALSIILTMQESARCQPPPPPPGGGNSAASHNLNNNQGAPIGDGVWILFMLALTYGMLQHIRSKKNSQYIDLKNLSSELAGTKLQYQLHLKFHKAHHERNAQKFKPKLLFLKRNLHLRD